MRRVTFFSLVLGSLFLAIAAPGCNIFQDIGNAECSLANEGAGGDDGAGGDGAGGDDVAGGGGAAGAGDATSGSTTAGAGGAPGAGSGAGAGADPSTSGAGAGPGARHVPRHRWPIRHHVLDPIDCLPPAVSVNVPPPPSMMAPPAPVLVGLTTTKLRAIAAYLKIGAGFTGVQLNNKIGLAFETWVLFMLNQTHWMTLIPSPARANKTNGLPASVVPDCVTDLSLFSTETGFTPFPESEIWEVKAVGGALTPSYSRYQILGLLDVARMSAAGTSTLPKHPPPVVVFSTTANTTVAPSTLVQATQWGVAVWQETVAYDATDPTDQNPDLCFGRVVPMNQDVYPAGGTPQPQQLVTSCSKLSSPTTQPVLVPGDPDPPTVDG